MSDDERLSPNISLEQERFARILFPHFSEQHLRVRETRTRFVHYIYERRRGYVHFARQEYLDARFIMHERRFGGAVRTGAAVENLS
jgi:hypothetical protein